MKGVLPSLLNPMFAPPSPIFTRLFDCPYMNLTRRSVRKGELVDEIAGRRLPGDIGFYIGREIYPPSSPRLARSRMRLLPAPLFWLPFPLSPPGRALGGARNTSANASPV